MAVTINASTSTGLVQSADTSGEIELQSNGTTALKVNTNEGIQILNCLGVGNATPSTSGAGITFPATQSASTDANTLDDYEEGTWTPVDSSGAGLTLSSASGTYTKIGRMVYCQGTCTYPSTSNGTQVTVGGLPFTGSAQLGIGGFITYTDYSSYIPTLPMANGNAYFYMYTTSGNALTNAGASTRNFRFTIIYSV